MDAPTQPDPPKLPHAPLVAKEGPAGSSMTGQRPVTVLPAGVLPRPHSCTCGPPSVLSWLPSCGRCSASCKSRGGGGEQGLDQIKKCVGGRTFLAARLQPGAETALLRPTISASAASILWPPAAVLLRPGRKVVELDQRLKNTKQRARGHTLVRHGRLWLILREIISKNKDNRMEYPPPVAGS